MAGVDSLLKILREHDADELKLGTDGSPRILRRGAPVRVTIPPTSDDVLRLLLGPVMTEQLDEALRTSGQAETVYENAGERYEVTLQRRGTADPLAFDITFRRGNRVQPSPTPSPTPSPPSSLSPTPSPSPSPSPSPPSLSPSPQLRRLLRKASSLRASDLHVFSGEPAMLRIDGSLRPLDELTPSVEELLAGVLQEGAPGVLAAGRSVDLLLDAGEDGRFRLNVYRSSGRLAAAVRVLPLSAPSLVDLRLPLVLDECIAAPHGLVIVCGPTGSGKSATLAALAEAALSSSAQRGHARLLITLEDPVEYVIRAKHGGLVRQRQVGNDVIDFPSGLRDALREDPDIVLIGEMRDPETIGLAMTAAETGHLVLTSLHSRSAASSIERIVDSYPPGRQQQIRVQLADALRAVIAQRLVPSARGEGRVPAVEILRGTSSVQSLIREGKTAQLPTAIQSGKKEGMVPLERSLADLVRSGQIDRERAQAAANDLLSLAGYLSS